MEFPMVPAEFSAQASANIMKAQVIANRAITESAGKPSRSLFRGAPPDKGWLVLEWVMTVFSAFASGACGLGKQGTWTADNVDRETRRFLYNLLVFASYKYDRREFSVPLMIDYRNRSITPQYQAVIEESPEWKQYQNELEEVATLQSRGETISTMEPMRGYRLQVQAWMLCEKISTVPEAAKRLGISHSTLKSIMTNRGEIRHSRETLERVLKVILPLGE
jgi:hypothetical protein